MSFVEILYVFRGRGKGKCHPRTAHDGPEGEYRYSSTHFLTTVLDVGGWSVPHPSHFTPRMETQYPWYRRLDGPQGWSGQVHKILPLQEFDSWTVQPVVSRVFKDYRILGCTCHLVAY